MWLACLSTNVVVHEAGGAGRFEGIASMTTTVSQRGQPSRGPASVASDAPIHTEQRIANPLRYGSCQHAGKRASLSRPKQALFAAYGDLPDSQERQRMRQRHPVLLEVLTSAGFLGVVGVQGYLVTRLGWPGLLLGLVSGFAWGLLFTFGVPSWLRTDLQVLRGHSRDELFPPREPSRARQQSRRDATRPRLP